MKINSLTTKMIIIQSDIRIKLMEHLDERNAGIMACVIMDHILKSDITKREYAENYQQMLKEHEGDQDG